MFVSCKALSKWTEMTKNKVKRLLLNTTVCWFGGNFVAFGCETTSALPNIALLLTALTGTISYLVLV